jgi:hypothetical protein
VQRLINILGVVLSAGVLSVGIAAAASLGLTTGRLSAGSVTVSGCTSSSLTASRNVDNNGSVTQVNVTQVPQACAGEVLSVTLESAGGASLAGASAIVGTCNGGCTVSVTGFGTVPGASVSAYAFSLAQ